MKNAIKKLIHIHTVDHEEEKEVEEGEAMIELDLEEGDGEEDGEDIFGSLLEDGE